MENVESIELNGIRTHNLKNFSIKFPLGKISVVTGMSGSGKSSLVFDTLYGEAYRRYVESLSSYARQYLKQMAKPDLDSVENLPPAIAVKQARSGLNQRSTVGTMTELTDVLRIIFGHISRVFCCGKELIKANGPMMAQDAMRLFPGEKLLFLAPLDAWGKLKAADLKVQLEAQGFTRCFVDGEVHKIGDIKASDLKRSLIVADRVTATADNLSRMIEASELTLRLGRGRGVVRGDRGQEQSYNKQLVCPDCHMVYVDPSPTLFNHNHPQGACEKCQGFGRMPIKDRGKITPDLEGSILTENVAPWNFGEHKVYYRMAKKSAKTRGYDLSKAFKNYSQTEWKWLYEGDGGEFDGINGYFTYLDSKKYKAHYRIHAARFTTYVLCDVCHGFRLNAQALACRIGGETFVDIVRQAVADLSGWFGGLSSLPEVSKTRLESVEEATQEGLLRLSYLIKMGLGYLSLSRSARTLSGGEVQRINMARSLGSALTGTLFCLDEPSVGLHVRDSHNLLEVILELRDQGNTIVIVEHEQTIIRGAEYLIEIGPGAGHRGGDLVYSGDPQKYKFHDQVWPKGRPLGVKEKFLVLKDVQTHNLKNIESKLLLAGLNVVCGVSGSGKTSLIRHSLYPLLARALGQELDDEEPSDGQGSLGPLETIKQLSSVHFVSQESIGRSTRSTIATYLGFYDDIRKILATTPAAKSLGLTPGYFSFNVPGGRCETCKGLGYGVEDLSFLGEMPVTCSSCRGNQFTDETLAITYRSRNLKDILQLTIEEARAFFFEHAKLSRALDQIIGMGLGYVRLGQNTSSFSGGEAQRLKLLRLLLDAVDRKPCCLIFDEPSTGLSDKDVQQLLLQLLRLRDAGHTVIVVEHHLGLIAAADWLIEIGPEAAAAGGTLVFQGPPADIVKAKDSRTAPFLLSS